IFLLLPLFFVQRASQDQGTSHARRPQPHKYPNFGTIHICYCYCPSHASRHSTPPSPQSTTHVSPRPASSLLHLGRKPRERCRNGLTNPYICVGLRSPEALPAKVSGLPCLPFGVLPPRRLLRWNPYFGRRLNLIDYNHFLYSPSVRLEGGVGG
ncbi:hypothetical protein DFH09DRAFT_1285512, partial [Mycena vulgaris]